MDAPGSLLAPCFTPQKASDNYLRLCYLITLLCGDLFRDILSRYIKPADLRSQLDNNKQKLVNKFNKQQQDLIYPATGNTSLTAKDFDISIIYILLRNLCNIPSHNAGWGNPPAKGDTSIAACIERIRLTRNSISAHSTNAMIEDPMFEMHWKDLSDVVVQIETQLTGSDLYQRGLNFLHSCNLTSVGTEADHNEERNSVDTIYDERSARFAEFFDEIAEGVPVEKIARLKDFIQNSCKSEDIASLEQAISARDCLRYLRDAKLLTSSDVIFVQYLFKKIDCKELFAECYKYAEEQEALCFYEKPPANGYQNVLFHVKGNLSNYSLERIAKIRETVAVLLKCSSEEILIGGAYPSASFLLVLSIKDTYSCKLLALEQCDKDKLTKLDIDYIILDLVVINLEPLKESEWNIYFDPNHFNREKDENILLQEEKSVVSPLQHITAVYKKTESSDDKDLDNSNSETHDRAQKTEGPLSYADRRFSTNADSETYNRAQSKERPMSYADRRFSYNADSDLLSSRLSSLFLHEGRDEAPRPKTSPSMTNQEIYVRAQRTEGPMAYADRRFSDNSESETNDRAQRTERPLIYADRRFSDNADSENHYRSQRTERPMRYANRRLSNNTDSESLYDTRIPTRSGKIEHIRFHEICDPEIMMFDNYRTAKQMKPYGGGMFFTNRPLKLEEKIHLRGFSYSKTSLRKSRPTIKIGLTNTDPEEIREAVQQKKYYVRGLKEIKCFSDDDQTTNFFNIYICLCPNATLSVNGLQEYFYENQEISSYNSIWLVIEPYGIDSIKILRY